MIFALSTTNPTGAELFVELETAELRHQGYKQNGYAIPPTENLLDSPGPLEMNSWGLTIASCTIIHPNFCPGGFPPDSYFAFYPECIGEPCLWADSPEPFSFEAVANIGVFADSSVPVGYYSNTIYFSAVANYVDTMQDFTALDCYNMMLNQVTYLMDGRDGNSYRVKKMIDGNCWMIDNLQFAVGTEMTSNVYMTDDGTTTRSPDVLRYADLSSDPYCQSVGNCGYLYNWYTATGGTGNSGVAANANVNGSICPNNYNSSNPTSSPWRLPTSDGTTGGDFGYLNGMMAGDGTWSMATDATHAANWLPTGPWEGAFSGGWQNGLIGQTTSAAYWSSTAGPSPDSVYVLWYTASNMSPIFPVLTYGGVAIRCLVSP